MKIIYILEQFYLHGGIEKIVAQKANWLSQHGYDVNIITTNQKGHPPIYELNLSIDLIDLGINYTQGLSYLHPKNISKLPKHFFKLKKSLQQLKPDIVISLSLQFDYYFLPFITKAKTVREFHASRYLYNQERNNTLFLKKIKYKIHDFLEKKYIFNVVLNDDEKKHYASSNVVVIPNGINTDTSKQAKLINKEVIAAGRLAPVKNFEELIYIWKQIIQEHPDWKLKIYGEGMINYKNKLLSFINKYNLEKHCCVCGSTNKIEEKMLASSIYLMTSHTECYPMVLLEAKNLGLPVISYKSPYGPQNIIKHNNDGLVIELYDQEEFLKGLKELIADKERRLKFGNNSKKNIKSNDINVVMEQWVDLFKRVNTEKYD